MTSKLTLLVLHYRTPKVLKTCLEKLAAFAPGVRVIVLDSSPAAETPVVTTELLKVPNHSFAHMLNCGLKQVTTPYAAHLNADVFIGRDTLPHLLRAVQRSGVGMVGPTVRTPDGDLQNQGLPYRRHYRLNRSAHTAVSVLWLSGCMQLVRMEAAFAVGGMDASLRFYNEDMEWCFRFRRSGWACHLVNTEVLHLGGNATPKDPRFIVEGYRGGYKLSQRYHSAMYQMLHRTAVKAQSAWNERFSRDPLQRQAAVKIREMFQQRTFDESPFAETLGADPQVPASSVD